MTPWPYGPVFAHRCGGLLAPENTLVGLTRAAEHCSGVEFDAMLSRDGEPVLIHDETLDRTTNGSGRVAATLLADLQALDAGSWFAPRFAGERVPTLVEAAGRCLALGLDANVEIKPSTGEEEATGRIVALEVRASWAGAGRPPLLSSFSETALQAAAQAAPELPRGLLVDAIPPDWRERCRHLGVFALHADARFVDRSVLDPVRESGLWIVVYTENDPERARALFDWGVDCVITDRPELVFHAGPSDSGRSAPA